MITTELDPDDAPNKNGVETISVRAPCHSYPIIPGCAQVAPYTLCSSGGGFRGGFIAGAHLRAAVHAALPGAAGGGGRAQRRQLHADGAAARSCAASASGRRHAKARQRPEESRCLGPAVRWRKNSCRIVRDEIASQFLIQFVQGPDVVPTTGYRFGILGCCFCWPWTLFSENII